MFDPGGSKGRLRACLFLVTWRALLCEEVVHKEVVHKEAGGGCNVFWRLDDLGINLSERDRRIVNAVCIAINRCFPAAASSKMPCRRGRLEAT